MEIVSDILDFSTIEAGKLKLEQAEFNLQGILGATIQAMTGPAEGKNLQLACNLEQGVPITAVGDARRLQQILIILLSNGIKFTEKGGVELRVQTELAQDLTPLLHFTVRDTGIGIPQDKQQEIFQAFTQADSSTTRRFGGTGLGLTTASRLVEMMGGQIWVESKIGSGSTFHFTARLGTRAS